MHTSALDKVRQLRFEGYSVGMLALEIDLLREGRGTGSMSNAVDALARVATALRNTDDTLRAELGKLGIEWRGEASTIAQDVMMTSANFAEDATDKINESSQAAFGLSEAFQRALNTLPDSRTLREGADGLGTMDVLADLIGHETDHAAKVRAASAARDQAVDALNHLASTCADELASVRQLSEPGAIVLDHGQPPPAQPDTGAGAGAGYQTMAAAAESVSGPDGRPGGLPTAPVNAGPPSDGSPSGPNTTTGGAPSGGARTGGSGSGPGGPGSGDSGSGSSASESGGGGRPSSGGSDSGGSGESGSGGSGPIGGVTDPMTGSVEGRSGAQHASTMDGPGDSLGASGAGGSGGASPGVTAVPGTSGPGASSAPIGGTTALGGGKTAELLATGKLSGATAQGQPQTTLTQGQDVTTAVPVADEDGIAAAATAIGAAAVAGAMSAEPDRERRGNPYDVADDTDQTSRHEFDVGVIEDQAEANAVAEIEPDAGPDTPAYLEHAAPQAPSDARVRTHGIDDADLFADDRMVARDTIGEDPSNAYRDDRQDSP
ncbi:PPE domain-containing protein [Haloechinothrix halophila]|uniref:PPE domain-containing protein n=1 Tax=Haloechinothrix halophila TaxID=1069073 RepID=UPI00040AA54D|nr:PPE domain-containing protein [Haloechinothrix halophila]